PRQEIDPEIEERALRAEGQVRDLDQKGHTLDGERATLSEQLRDATRVPVDADAGRVAALEGEAAELRAELEIAKNELRDAIANADRAAKREGADPRRMAELETQASELRAELELTRTELREAMLRADRPATVVDDEELQAELDTTHIELLRTKDDLATSNTISDPARRELDTAQT